MQKAMEEKMNDINLVNTKRPYNLRADHTAIKKQIKEWEKEVDAMVTLLTSNKPLSNPVRTAMRDSLEAMSHEMMAINL